MPAFQNPSAFLILIQVQLSALTEMVMGNDIAGAEMALNSLENSVKQTRKAWGFKNASSRTRNKKPAQ